MSLLPRLGVNVDHVATVRQARHAPYPDPVLAASLAELGGAAQITVHLREDRRHIQDRDLKLLRKTVQTKLNLEMAATPEMLRVAFETRPDTVTLVPERRQEVTTEGGLDVIGQKDALKRLVAELKQAEIHVSLFVDPNVEQVQMAARIGADAIELHTGRFCEARTRDVRAEELRRIVDVAKTAVKLKLACCAGHGIHYDNVADLASILEIEELNIGHSIVARAIFVGMERAVREMNELARAARQQAVLAAQR
ncbi:MAG: pyridoxine 5'-phosphate synthase [Deltaproteobacteria bacterium]|nr:pyridoxine 5'-phosphate synthase [Deltaproteobacteria bacterium]